MGFRPIVVTAIIAGLALGVSFFASNTTPTSGSFEVSTLNVKLCNALDPADISADAEAVDATFGAGNPACVSTTAADTPYTLTLSFEFLEGCPSVPGAGDGAGCGSSNFSHLATIIPPDFFIAPGPGHPDFVGGTHPALSSVIGLDVNTATLGLSNNACNGPTNPEFIFYNSTVDIDDVGVGADAPLPEGTSDRFDPLRTDGNGDALGDDNSKLVTKYPRFINTLFDPDLESPDKDEWPEGVDGAADGDGNLPAVQPLARYAGISLVANLEWVPLQLLVFAPGDLSDATTGFGAASFNSTHPFMNYTADVGYVGIVVLQDPTEIEDFVSAITDFCSYLNSTLFVKSTAGGLTVQKTALDGTGTNETHAFYQYGRGYRDFDGDGIENQLDTCASLANLDPDPHVAAKATGSSETPGDMIDSVCDPTDDINGDGSAESINDHDTDGFQNAQDNCPLVENGTAADGSGGAANINNKEDEQARVYNLAAPDGGPKTDGVGNPCDSEMLGGAADNVANGAFQYDVSAAAFCIGGTDGDGDGWCAGAPTDTNDAAPGTHGAFDSDGDGFTAGSGVEPHINTDPLNYCPATSGTGADHDSWPPDFNMTKLVNIVDVGAIRPHFGAAVTAANIRYDLSPSATINIVDVGAVRPYFNLNCDPATPGGGTYRPPTPFP